MTDDDKPSAQAVFGALNGTNLLLTVWCQVCDQRIGVVLKTDYGPLWFGFLHNPDNSRFRQSMGVSSEKGKNGIPMWVEDWRTYYSGECRCRRNSADGHIVWRALQARKRKVAVPAQS